MGVKIAPGGATRINQPKQEVEAAVPKVDTDVPLVMPLAQAEKALSPHECVAFTQADSFVVPVNPISGQPMVKVKCGSPGKRFDAYADLNERICVPAPDYSK